MRVPEPLSRAFGPEFQKQLTDFATQQGLIPEEARGLESERFLARSVVPHIIKLSERFNRLDVNAPPGAPKKAPDPLAGLGKYWKDSSNPKNLRLAYLLYFMPANLYRVASVICELERLGYRWPLEGPMRALELGAGPAAGASGIAAGAHHAPGIGIPKAAEWTLVEQDRAMLTLGADWAQDYFTSLGLFDWGTRPQHRTLNPGNTEGGRRGETEGFLDRKAPRYHLWLSSYFLNELPLAADAMADQLVLSWRRHLEDEALVILVEPALRTESRKLLELRAALIAREAAGKGAGMQVLLPCLGHQGCGALADSEDWCHDEVAWWRPPYYRVLDKLAGLDRKTLPFSYLVLTKSKRPLGEILPALAGGSRTRLVSPARAVGRDLEFYTCDQGGKARTRLKADEAEALQGKSESILERGDILIGGERRGDANSARLEGVKKRVG